MSFAIYFDEDSQDRELLRILRERKIAVSCVNDFGMRERPDEEQLAFATSKASAIFTYNVAHFCRIHADWVRSGQRHSGIIVAPQQRFHLGELAMRIVRIHGTLSAEEMANRLEYLSNW